MAISTNDLLLEIGSKAYNSLTSDEIIGICTATDNVVYAAMKAFELLWKNYKPSYRMGKMYKAESDRYDAYYKMYCWYTQQVGAGRSGEVTTPVDIDKWRNELE